MDEGERERVHDTDCQGCVQAPECAGESEACGEDMQSQESGAKAQESGSLQKSRSVARGADE